MLALLLITVAAAADDKGQSKPATPEEESKALVKEFYEQTHAFSFKANSDEERAKAVARMDKLRILCLELAEKNPKDALRRSFVEALRELSDLGPALLTARPSWAAVRVQRLGERSASPRVPLRPGRSFPNRG